MCGACFTSIDAVGLQSIGFAGAALSSFRRALLRWRGVSKLARRTGDWEASAAFLEGLGHDPVALLGPRPVGQTPAPVAVSLKAVPEPILV